MLTLMLRQIQIQKQFIVNKSGYVVVPALKRKETTTDVDRRRKQNISCYHDQIEMKIALSNSDSRLQSRTPTIFFDHTVHIT
uniref:Uncharacterized protein n=1 Tax=Arion vulgaris TaxID=1028688 RepID=A0A0B7ALI1_9EUPU